jgi:hypothetical protein
MLVTDKSVQFFKVKLVRAGGQENEGIVVAEN